MFRSRKSLDKHVQHSSDNEANPLPPPRNNCSLVPHQIEPQSSTFVFRAPTIVQSIVQPSSHPTIRHGLSLSPLSQPVLPQNSTCQSASASQVESLDAVDERESRLLSEVEIIDEQGNVLRMQKMSVNDVYRLLGDGERILVHIDELSQPIKAAGGLCTRFMTSLIGQPNLVPLDAENFPEVKTYCGARLVAELREKFSLPFTSEMDKVIFDNFGSKFRSVKYRFKEKLKKKAKIALKVARQKSDAYVEGEENNYTEEQVFEALDLIPPPSGVADHQWEKYKSNITSKKAQDLSKKGKEARGTQIHTRTTGGISYARIKDEFKLKKKRKPTEVEFFELAYQTKKGTYVQEESKEFMDKAKDLVAQKTMEVGVSGPIDFATESQIHSAVWKELIEGESPRRPLGYGIGVTKSQVTKLSDDLRIMRRGRSSSIEVHALEAKVIAQDKQIQSMGNTINDLKSQVQLFFTAFGMSGGTFSSPTMSSPLLRNAPTLQSQGQVQDDGSNVNAMNIPSAYIPSPYDHHEDVCG